MNKQQREAMQRALDLARECGATYRTVEYGKRMIVEFYTDQLEAFAARIRADERETGRKLLTDGEILEMGHRRARTYRHSDDPKNVGYGFDRSTLVDFARAVEAKHVIAAATPQGVEPSVDTPADAIQAAVLAERERCALVADAISNKYAYGFYGNEVDTADEIADAIRKGPQ